MLNLINSADTTKRVFCYIRGGYHAELFYSICRQNPDIEFYFHSDLATEDEYRKSVLYELKNAFFVKTLSRIAPKLNLFGAFITTDAHAADAHLYALKLINIFHQLHVPVLELQHGLFQLGLHYYDVPRKENVQPDALPTSTFADCVLAYDDLPEDIPGVTIGYPPYDNEEKIAYEGEYTLVLSNLHWRTYTDEERYAFYRSIFEYAEREPEQFLIWKMHPAEVANKDHLATIQMLRTMFPGATRRIIFAHESALMKRMPAAALISKAQQVISSISTVLLDCERFRKPTYVYKAASTECLWTSLEDAPCFSNGWELVSVVKPGSTFKTGRLRPYDNAAFRAVIDKMYRLSDLSQAEFLSILIPSLS